VVELGAQELEVALDVRPWSSSEFRSWKLRSMSGLVELAAQEVANRRPADNPQKH